ncbi:hypothetical protein DT603_04790 [Pseudoxanthomonas gei]|uniref:Tetratricopeptide repeat-containing protein n=1 Tax=Pseudoxanthomonas gei TaxID=1383030 RepID=A0ABX0ACC6_9GAMM|nr:hypothetical protein [Pseudoxanthomonas gei]
MLALTVVVFRHPLAKLVWPDMRVQRLLDDAELAMRQGRLSNPDGSGARQRFEAAQALDADRSEARDGLSRLALAAVAQARAQLQANRLDQARQSLQLARELQVPQAEADAVAEQLRQRESAHAGLDELVRRAETARAAGQLQIALPLYQRVLALQPTHTAALEGREDALSELLQQARRAIADGELARGAGLVAQAREQDAGHVDLPEAQAQLARAADLRRSRADADLRRQKLQPALEGYRQVLHAVPGDPAAAQGIERVATAYAQRAAREAADFRFDAAQDSLASARDIAPRAAVVVEAEQALVRARQAQLRLVSPLPGRERQRRTQALLASMQEAEARGEWLTPPGESAYDKLRAAQAISPADPAVQRASRRLLPAVRACLEDELRANRIRRARACYDAWQALQPRDAGLAGARRQLASKWIAVGDERLGSGDVEFAALALREAQALDAAAPGLDAFAARVHSAHQGDR